MLIYSEMVRNEMVTPVNPMHTARQMLVSSWKAKKVSSDPWFGSWCSYMLLCLDTKYKWEHCQKTRRTTQVFSKFIFWDQHIRDELKSWAMQLRSLELEKNRLAAVILCVNLWRFIESIPWNLEYWTKFLQLSCPLQTGIPESLFVLPLFLTQPMDPEKNRLNGLFSLLNISNPKKFKPFSHWPFVSFVYMDARYPYVQLNQWPKTSGYEAPW